MTDSWHNYPSIFALGHRALAELFADSVVIEEKVDGSQFSFGLIAGELRFRSKGQEIYVASTPKMFAAAVESVQSKAELLHPDWTYRAEYLEKPKHNALAYNRIPEGHLAIFDINTDNEAYLDPASKAAEAARIGLESVPAFHVGPYDAGVAGIAAYLAAPSFLGGQLVEGVVVKNYSRFGEDKKALMGKYVSEAFKEVHRGEWKKNNPNKGEFITTLADSFRTPARFNKAIQHLRDDGNLQGSPRDIGPLIAAVKTDVLKECGDEIRQRLFEHFWPEIQRGFTRGLAEWYKDELLKAQFVEEVLERVEA